MSWTLSIRSLLGAVIGLMGLTIAGLVGNALLQANYRYDAAKRVVALSALDSVLFQALQNFRIERGDMDQALRQPTDKGRLPLQSSLARRALVEAGMVQVLAELGQLAMPDLESASDRLKTDYATVRRLREQADQNLALALDGRDKSFIDSFIPTSGRLQPDIEAVLTILESEIRRLDPNISDILLIKAMAWSARSFIGENTLALFSALVAGHGFSLSEQAQMKFNDGRIAASWSEVQSIAQRPNAPPQVKQAVAKAQDAYFAGPFARQREALAAALSANTAPPISLDEWRNLATPAVGEIGSVAVAAMDLVTHHAEVSAYEAWLSAIRYAVALLAALAFSVAGFVLTRLRVARPITMMTHAMRQLSEGDVTTEVPGVGRMDEIGGMAAAVQVFRDSMVRNRALEAEATRAREDAAAQRKADMARVAQEFQTAIGNIVDAVLMAAAELEAAAGSLSGTADTTQQLSGLVAAASEQASDNVKSVATAAEQMTNSVNEISRQVHESSKIASEAVQQAEKTDTRIAQLSEAANRIGDVVKLITAIAEQTNLLALNATIEAARAGEAGRGFAVVASEVKSLANQTAKATGEIGAQIANMQAATRESVVAIKEIGQTINRVSDIAAAIATAVAEQGAATEEIGRNVQQAARGTSDVAGKIVEVNRGAGETGSASTRVLASAQSLSHEGGRLKVEVERFLATVRAA